MQMKALSTVMLDTEYDKFKAGNSYGVTRKTYVSYKKIVAVL